jgi:hypothetical protein
MNCAQIHFVRAAIAATRFVKPIGQRSGQTSRLLRWPVPIRLLLATASVVLMAGHATGAIVEWSLPSGQSGDWSVASNWNTGFVPVSVNTVYILNAGTATITLSGAACNQLAINRGYIQMASGSLDASNLSVNNGSMAQSGGTTAVLSSLNVGNLTFGTYLLTGSGQLSALSESVSSSASNSLFQQSGGLNAIGNLLVDFGGSYVLSGGSLAISGNFTNRGTLDAGGGTGSLIATNAIVDLSQGTIQNTGSMSVGIDANSLLLLPAGFNLATGFGTLNLLGIAHVGGSALVVPAGMGFSGQVAINDPVNCQGTILAASGGSINLTNGLSLSGSGVVNLGSGTLSVNDPNSGVTSGSLSAAVLSIGASGAGVFSQSGGTSTLTTSLFLNNGTYNLSGNATLSAPITYIGNGGMAHFNQSSGTHTLSVLDVGYAGTGSYTITGGLLSANGIYVGRFSSASGTLSQSGTAAVTASSNVTLQGGTYSLTDAGLLSTNSLTIAGNFFQSGGVDTVGGSLSLGYGGSGTYSLSGSGRLSATSETMGFFSTISLFQQNGGLNSVGNLLINGSNRYLLSGGSLSINGGFTNKGTFDGGGGAASLTASSSIIDLSQGTIQNTDSMSVSIDANSLLLLPAGFNLATGFGTLNSLGVAHVIGTPLVVPAGTRIVGQLAINDPVSCQGVILAPTNGSVSLGNGLALSGTGVVGLGSGTLTVNDQISGITSGSLAAPVQLIGNKGTGLFNQSGGTSKLNTLFVDNGTYYLSGNATLSSTNAYVANGGPANFNQSGGTHSVLRTLYIGNAGSGTYAISGGMLSAGTINVGTFSSPGTMLQSASSAVSAGFVSIQGGMYNLSDNGKLTAGSVGVAGNFSQSGGKVAIANSLTLGIVSGDVRLYGAYNLSGNAQLSASNIFVGNGLAVGVFTQSGGTNTVVGSLNVGGLISQQGSYNNDSSYSLGDGSLLLSKSSNISGTFLQSGGTQLITSNLLMTGSSAYSLNGNALLSESNSYMDGSFTQAGGTQNVAANFYLSYLLPLPLPYNIGSYNLSGNALLSTSDSYLGGSFVQTGGTHNIAANVYVGYSFQNASSSGTYSLTGNALLSTSNAYVGAAQNGIGIMTVDGNSSLIAQNLYIAQSGTGSLAGSLTQSGGTVAIANTVSLGNIGQTGTYNLNGGLLSARTLNVNLGASKFTQSGGTNTIANSLVVSSGTYSIANGLLSAANVSIGLSTSPATFSQTGGSTAAGLILVGTSGRFTVSGGSLSINSGLSIRACLTVRAAWRQSSRATRWSTSQPVHCRTSALRL